ncbi:MAG: TRAP transporter fused permease subunit, partial [Burkholderiales bacterium]|nr:TRAP transporter fused permease subunit [Burkholderiales bacterium]
MNPGPAHATALGDAIETVSTEQQRNLIRQFDHESNFRRLAGPVGMLVTAIAVLLSSFHIYTAGFGLLDEIKHRSFHLMLVLGLIFLVFPHPVPAVRARAVAKEWSWAAVFGAFYLYLAWDLVGRLTESGELASGWPFLALVAFLVAITLPVRRFGGYEDEPSWIDWPLALAAAGISLYFLVFFDDVFIRRVGSPNANDYMMGVIAIIMVMEATRRTMGPLLPVIGMACLLYALLGRYMPGVLAHRGYSVVRVVNHIYIGTEGIYGIAVGVVATYVFHFVLFGVLAQMTGLGRLFMDLATLAAGRFSGGPAKASVVSSGLFGMISGSAIANAVTTGSLTIPMMKKYGFSPRFAGAVEASASCGGQVTPPVMGASAFVMAELLGVPYKHLVIIAIVPALFHYLACLLMVHFEAKRLKLHGLPAHMIPSLRSALAASWHLVLPLVVLVTLLLLDYTPFLAAFWGIVLCFACSYIPPVARRFGYHGLQGETLTPKPLVAALDQGAKYALAIGAACACVGLILGTLTLSGLGFKFSGAVVELAGAVSAALNAVDPFDLFTETSGKVFFGLLFVAIACILMGTGVPTTPTYIILASIAAPALATLGVPLLATHFFVFYYGVLADVTPPVALAAYAAAG